MFLNLRSLIIMCVLLGLVSTEDGGSSSRVLSRKRRYVTFPDGSSFSAAGCVTVGLIGQPAPTSTPGTFTFGLNWGIAYELPNATETLAFYHKKKGRKPMAQRRSRRELYGKIEDILDNYMHCPTKPGQHDISIHPQFVSLPVIMMHVTASKYRELVKTNMGYNGRQCILKTLCETTQRIVPHGDNMVEEIFRTLFSFPLSEVLPEEPLEHTIYDAAHRLGTLLENCDVYKCPLSLVDMAQGYYNAPSPKVDLATSPWAMFSSRFG